MKAPAIVTRSLSHAFTTNETRREILRSLDLTVMPGEVVVVTGVSGAGKTTLLTLIGALRSIQSGSVEVVGKRFDGLDAEQRRQVRASIGFIFQSHNLLDALTAGQNVLMSLLGRDPLDTAIAKTQAALTSLGLGARIDSFPEQLSGGEKQRVAVARALVREPAVILADEPTASLDDLSAHVVKDSIRAAADRLGSATLLVTHDSRVFDIADRILQLTDGSLVDAPRTALGTRRLAAAT